MRRYWIIFPLLALAGMLFYYRQAHKDFFADRAMWGLSRVVRIRQARIGNE